MALFDNLFKADTAKGLAIGIGVAVAAPVVVSSLLGASRPLARAAIKSGMILYEKGREAAAEFSEVMEDLVAEARAEVEQEHASRATAKGLAPAGAAGASAAAEGDGEAKDEARA